MFRRRPGQESAKKLKVLGAVMFVQRIKFSQGTATLIPVVSCLFKRLASHCKAETTFTFHFSVISALESI